jgi:hypothetical protein
MEAEEKAMKEAQEKAKMEAEEKALKDAEEKAKMEAEEKAMKEAQEKAKMEAEEKPKGIMINDPRFKDSIDLSKGIHIIEGQSNDIGEIIKSKSLNTNDYFLNEKILNLIKLIQSEICHKDITSSYEMPSNIEVEYNEIQEEVKKLEGYPFLKEILEKQNNVIKIIPLINDSYYYKREQFNIIDRSRRRTEKSRNFNDAKAKINSCFAVFRDVLLHIKQNFFRETLNNVIEFILMFLNFDMSKIEYKEIAVVNNAYVVKFNQLLTTLKTDVYAELIIIYILKYIVCYLNNIFEDIILPPEFEKAVDDLNIKNLRKGIILGGDSDDNFIYMITLKALNSVLLFNNNKLDYFIDKVNVFNSK